MTYFEIGEANEYDTATLWRYRIETAVQVASQQKHSKQVDRLRWIVSREIYAAAKGDCNEKVRRDNQSGPEEGIGARRHKVRARAGCKKAAGEKKKNVDNTRPSRPKCNQNSNWKGRNYSKTEASCTPADVTRSIWNIARNVTDVFRSQSCNKNICWKRVES